MFTKLEHTFFFSDISHDLTNIKVCCFIEIRHSWMNYPPLFFNVESLFLKLIDNLRGRCIHSLNILAF